MSTEIQQLEREIAERVSKLAALKRPMSRDEIRDLAKNSPDTFNAKLDAGEIDLAAMAEETS
jgi:hypothetical protein